jgi:hypothetical protein
MSSLTLRWRGYLRGCVGVGCLKRAEVLLVVAHRGRFRVGFHRGGRCGWDVVLEVMSQKV